MKRRDLERWLGRQGCKFLREGARHLKNVLVVGLGNSALDIAVESSFVAGRTFICSRRGAHVLPKYALGRPIDQIAVSPLTPLVPFPVRHALFRAIYRLVVGRVERYGMPKPDHRLLESHPALSADFLGRSAQGEITWKPEIEALGGDRVRFVDGSAPDAEEVPCDARLRYRTRQVRAVYRDRVLELDEPFSGAAPGQAAVMYRGSRVLGGGTIRAAG